ncbi:hypothetical protein ABH19_02755 [Leptospirillum sp. Group II 'CF-1']|nr:hypothetical protein ABH19_02755 [Leptospirillum sp. Group II 'CF-1']
MFVTSLRLSRPKTGCGPLRNLLKTWGPEKRLAKKKILSVVASKISDFRTKSGRSQKRRATRIPI